MSRAKRRTLVEVGEVCLYGNRDKGFGYIVRDDAGALADGGFDAEDRLTYPTSCESVTTAIFLAGEKLRAMVAERHPRARMKTRAVWVYEPSGGLRALVDLDSLPTAGALYEAGSRGVIEPMSAAPVYVISADAIAAASSTPV